MLGLPHESVEGAQKSSDPAFDRMMRRLDKVGGNVVEFDRGRRANARSGGMVGDEPRSLMDVLRRIERSGIPRLSAKVPRFMAAGKELEGVLATARTHLQFLDSEQLRADLSVQRPFRFEQMKEKLVTVYVILPAEQMHIEMQGRWLRVFVDAFLRAMLRSPPSATVGRVLCLIDEAAALGHFAPLEAAMGYLRGFGTQLFTVWQDLPQLKRHYVTGWESFIAASGAVLAYAPNDMTTCRYLSALCGMKTEQVTSYSQDRETLEWRPSLGARELSLFSPQRLMGLEDGEILCRLQGMKPFRTRGVVYTKTPFFDEGNGPLRPNPYYKG
jgi:type IV secretory pathway TraG/TraD family ATPase VirD4